jgi:hypothetical protein
VGVVLAAGVALAAAEKGVTAAGADVVVAGVVVAGVIDRLTLAGLIPNCCKVAESAADRAV